MRKIVGSRYIIVSGNLSYQSVEDFLSEFYHPSHAKGPLLNKKNLVLFFEY